MAKKLNKFERLVRKALRLTPQEAVNLLRQYHKEVSEMIQRLKIPDIEAVTRDYRDGHERAVTDTVAKLKELTK